MVDYAALFHWAGNLAVLGWILLAVLPRWRWTTALITPILIPGALAVLYAILIFSNIRGADGDFASLAGVKQLFQYDGLLLAGWIHYLAFDLFVGSWEVRDAQRLNIPHLAVVPCLFLTLMLGPVGLLAYLILRAALRRSWSVAD